MKDFIERSKIYTNEQNYGRVARALGRHEGWLAAPPEFSRNFIAGPWGESVPLANIRVLEFEAEPHDADWLFVLLGMTTGGGDIIFNPENEDLVELLSEFDSALADYPILSENEHSKVEMEMWEEAIENWMFSAFIREAARHRRLSHAVDYGGGAVDWLEDLVFAHEHLEDLVHEILWGFLGHYGADDPSYDSDAAAAFANSLGSFFEHLRLNDLFDFSGYVDVQALVSQFEAHEFQFVIGRSSVDHGHIEPSDSRNMTAIFRTHARDD